MNKDEQYIEIDLLRLLGAMWRNAVAIIIAVIIGAVALFSYASFMITPTYQAQALMYVNNKTFNVGSTSVSFSTGELAAAQSLVKTYTVILNTRTTLNEVITKASLPYSYETLSKMISASSVNSTEVFSITVTSTNPEEAALIANTIADILPERISEVLDGSSARVVDYAVTPTKKVAPSISKYTAIGAILGFIIAAAIICVREIMDDTIHSQDDITSAYDLPILAVIPDLDADSSSSDSYYYDYGSNERRKGKGA